MSNTKEMKQRFLTMLDAKQIIVIQCNRSEKRKSYDFKFIGADSYGRWDFTPLVAECSGYPTNKGVSTLAVRGLDGASIIADVLRKLIEEGFSCNQNLDGESYYSICSYCDNRLCTFYL